MMHFGLINEENLNKFKALYPNDQKIQNVTLEELKKYAEGKKEDGSSAKINPQLTSDSKTQAFGIITDCEIAVAGVVIDCILVIAGAVGIHGRIPSSAIEEVARIIKPELPEIEKIVQILAHSGSTTYQKAKAVFNIGKLIYSAGMLEAVYKAIVNSLTWWDMILYGVIGLAELTAIFLTDGAALIAVIVAEIAQIGFVISDSVKVVQQCNH